MAGPAEPRLNRFDDAVLAQIAQYCDNDERQHSLPLVSRRWWRLLRGPSAAWETLVVDLDAELPAGVQPNAGAMAAWFQRRAGSVRHLTLTGDAAVMRLPALLFGAIVMSQCSSLRSLEINVPACGISGSDLGVLAACTQLTSLRVRQMHGSSWTDHSVGLFRSIKHLPALQVLFLPIGAGRPLAALPGLEHFTAMRSATLTRLFAVVDSRKGGTLHLAGLPTLRDLGLGIVGTRELPDLTMASSFTAVSSLTRLHLRGSSSRARSITLHPDSLRPLLRLRHLGLPNCGLTEIPAALAAVGLSLRELDVSQNRQLQLTTAAYDMLLSMPELRTLIMKKGSGTDTDTSSMWTDVNVQRIVSLGRAHALRYPQPPPLEIQIV